jgi:catechol-2,3-dioxygenase
MVTTPPGSHRLSRILRRRVDVPFRREEEEMASPKITHLVVNTSNYEAMKDWYINVLEATIGVEATDHSACFLRTDEGHHSLGMFNVGKTDESGSMALPGSDTGTVARLNHFAFEHSTLEELLETHARLAGSSTNPAVSLNHGLTMSIYYEDPDKNVIELYYDTGYTEEGIVAFYAAGDRYILSPTPFDPAALLKELQNGKPEAELIAWSPPSE